MITFDRLSTPAKNCHFLKLVLILGLSVTAFYTARPAAEFSSYLVRRIFNNNFYEVIPGRYYRSAQMPYSDLTTAMNKYQIKTVIDLRKGWDDSRDGVTEETVVVENGGKYVRLRLGSRNIPTKDRLRRLISLLKDSPTPILVHCSDGTHRTGFVSFLWMLEVEHSSVEEAMQQLSPKFGYLELEQELISLWRDNKPLLGSVVWDYSRDNSKTGIGFEDWVRKNIEVEPRE